MSFGLSERTLKDIAGLLKRYPEIKKVQIFGSRAMGTYKSGSDVDIVLWGDIDADLLTQIAAGLDNLPTPYKFDICVYDQITHQPLKDHIDRHGVDFLDALQATR